MVRRIDTRMLRMIIALADAPSAAAAARRLNITPSALSHQLRKAEEMLAVALFERSGRRSALTPLGEQLLASARVIVAELDKAEEKLERSRRGAKPTIRSSGGAYSVHLWFTAGTNAVPDHWSHVDFVATTKGSTLAHSVASGELDIAFICGLNLHRGLVSVPLFEDKLVVAIAKNHALAREPFIEAKHLRDLVYITYSQVVEPGLEDDLFFRPARFAPARVREANSFNAILDLVAAKTGFTILSRWELDQHRRAAELAALSITKNGLKVAWSALIRKLDVDRTDLAHLISFTRNNAPGTSLK